MASTQGKCSFCEKSYAKGGISRHFAACDQRKLAMQEPLGSGQGKVRTTSLYHLQIEGTYNPQYWLHIELPGDTTLKFLDTFLRDIWLECCGHLSAFKINGTSYAVQPFPEFDDKRMNIQLARVLNQGLTFAHEYDFGTTTDLKLKVVGVREGQAQGKTIQIMARNDPPKIKCAQCDKPSTQVCSVCVWEGDEAWLCDEHLMEHECGEEMALPVVNSPRVGMCGYTG